jgi:hypothetical protein
MKRTILLTIVAMDLALATNAHSVSPVSNKQEHLLLQLTQGPTKKAVPYEFESRRRDNERKTPRVLVAPCSPCRKPPCPSCLKPGFQDWVHQLKFALFWL